MKKNFEAESSQSKWSVTNTDCGQGRSWVKGAEGESPKKFQVER